MYCPTCGSSIPEGGTCPSCNAAPGPGADGVPPRTSGLAIASFVVALVGLVTCILAPLTFLPALILGRVALVQIGKSEGRLGGQGLAIAGVCLAGVNVLVVPVVAAIAIPNLVASRAASNEAAAIASLRAYLSAQSTFRRTDFYGKGMRVYANPSDGKGFPDLYEVGGNRLTLIDSRFAEATSPASAKFGYYFADIEYDDYSNDCGLCAVPAAYNRSGRNVFIVDATGTVYQKDAAALHPGIMTGDPVPPVTVYPGAAEIATWLPVGY